jgi:hypothetical protein
MVGMLFLDSSRVWWYKESPLYWVEGRFWCWEGVVMMIWRCWGGNEVMIWWGFGFGVGVSVWLTPSVWLVFYVTRVFDRFSNLLRFTWFFLSLCWFPNLLRFARIFVFGWPIPHQCWLVFLGLRLVLGCRWLMCKRFASWDLSAEVFILPLPYQFLSYEAVFGFWWAYHFWFEIRS